MRHVARAVIGLTILGSIFSLGLSVWPGKLSEAVFTAVLFGALTAIVWIPVGAAVLIGVAVILGRRRRSGELAPISWIEPIMAGFVLLVSLGLLFFNVPRRLGFALSRAQFESQIAAAPKSSHGVSLDKRLGVYQVDRYATDPRGGTYFRVFEGSDGIGPDTMSYGFVKTPNTEGTPFGAAHYRYRRLIGDWYWFIASDDWW
jgi:hypothetical protein